MHRTLPTLSLLLFVPVAFAQIPNSGFENWSAPNGHDEPDGWLTLNDFTAPYGVFTCAQGMPGHSGTSCLQLITQPIPSLTTVAGQAITGDAAALMEGFPYTARPGQLDGWWKYETPFPGPDFGLVSVVLTRWDTGTQQRVDIGAGFLPTPGTMTLWQPFTVPIDYFSPDFPDTAVIAMISSGGLLQPGNALFVDDLGFDTGTQLEEMSQAPAWILADDLLQLPFAEVNDRISVRDALGREIITTIVATVPFSLDLSSLPGGVLMIDHSSGMERRVMRVVR